MEKGRVAEATVELELSWNMEIFSRLNPYAKKRTSDVFSLNMRLNEKISILVNSLNLLGGALETFEENS